MANVEVVIKGIKYDFQKDHYYEMARNEAINDIKQSYLDEQEFEQDEFYELNVSSYDEYCEAVGKRPTDVDYRKDFEDNISHPIIAQQIENKINQYMCNIYDLPKSIVLTIDDNKTDISKPDESTIRSFIKDKFGDGVEFKSYERAAKAELKDTFAQLSYDKVGEMIKSEDFQTFLNLRASVEKYSFKNIALIYAQKPDAKVVMSLTAWNKNGRQIEKGSKALKIWKPLMKNLTNEKQVDNYISYHYADTNSQEALKEKDELMKRIEQFGKAEILYGYTLGSTFDISSTIPKDGVQDNLDDILRLNKPLNKSLNNYDEIIELMSESAFAVPFVELADYGSEQDILFDSVYNFADKLLSQKPDAVKGIKDGQPFRGDMHKIESVMSTYLICKHIGIDCEGRAGFLLSEIFNKDFTPDMIRLGKRDMFMQCFDRACHVADQFNSKFDEKFQTLQLYKGVNESYKDIYTYLYNHNNVDGYNDALAYGVCILSNMPKEAEGVIKYLSKTNVDFISSDREVAALALALVANNITRNISPNLEDEVEAMRKLLETKVNGESSEKKHKKSDIDIDR